MLTYPEEKDLNANNTEIAKEVSEILNSKELEQINLAFNLLKKIDGACILWSDNEDYQYAECYKGNPDLIEEAKVRAMPKIAEILEKTFNNIIEAIESECENLEDDLDFADQCMEIYDYAEYVGDKIWE